MPTVTDAEPRPREVAAVVSRSPGQPEPAEESEHGASTVLRPPSSFLFHRLRRVEPAGTDRMALRSVRL